MQFHEVANIFPMMSELEFSELKDSIKTHGVREPALVVDGMIADGRNRWRACEALGIACPTVQYDPAVHGDSLIQYVLDKNLRRRQLTVSQRAVVATNALPMIEAEADVRKKAGVKNASGESETKDGHQTDTLAQICAKVPRSPKSAEIAAASVGVSTRLVEQAKAVKKAAPEIAEKVARGEVTLNAAVKQVKELKLPPRPPRPEFKDETGRAITFPAAVEAWKQIPELEEVVSLIAQVKRAVKAISDKPISAHLNLQRINLDIDNLRTAVKWGRPHAQCPFLPNCTRGCKTCGGSGFVNEDKWKHIPTDIRKAAGA
jgi:ParB-like chromosome segregation protein Spo0J